MHLYNKHLFIIYNPFYTTKSSSIHPTKLSKVIILYALYCMRALHKTPLGAVWLCHLHYSSEACTACVKADMKLYINFSSEPIHKTGCLLSVCQSWFHLQRLPRAVWKASTTRITKWKKSFPMRDSNAGPSAYGANALPLNYEDWCLSGW